MSEELLENRVYKVKQLTNGRITIIYVFYGNSLPSDTSGLLEKIFTTDELTQIKSENIKVNFLKQTIHLDDSILTIKIKILTELNKHSKKNVLEEIYLYSQNLISINTYSIYQSITNKKKVPLTKIRFEQFLSNMVTDESGQILPEKEDKEVYTFDDIFDILTDKKKYVVNKALGQQFFTIDGEYPFVCNPYHVKVYDEFYEKYLRNSLLSLNSHLLLNSGPIIDNSIYLCLMPDVADYINQQLTEPDEKTTVKLYYPLLYKKNILSIDELERKRNEIFISNQKLVNEKTKHTFKNVDMFYDIFFSQKSQETKMNYVNQGIKYIKAVIKPDIAIKISLEVLFKIIHATEETPLIKYNPSNRQENIYRLFTDKISTDGRKIPLLKMPAINKLKKSIARNKSVSVYIEMRLSDGTLQILVCDFDENGYITITTEFKEYTSLEQIDELFKNAVNPIIQEIKNVLEQSGYKLNKFNSLMDENIEVKQITYETQLRLKQKFSLESYKNCLSCVFTDESIKSKKNILRFKRVSNYNKFTAQEAFILEQVNQGLNGSQIIDTLLENFKGDIDRSQANDMVVKIMNEITTEKGSRKTDITIKNNPGFKTTIINKDDIITITTENINNIYYLRTIPIYIDTMVRLSQDSKLLKEMKKICSDDVQLENFISALEIKSDKKDDSDTSSGENIAFQLFMDEIDIEEEDDEITGGNGTSSELSSATPITGESSREPSVEEPAIKSESSIESESFTEPLIKSESSIESEHLIKSESSVKSLEPLSEPSTEPSEPSVEEPSIEEPAIKSESSIESEPLIKSESSVKSLEPLSEPSTEPSVAKVIESESSLEPSVKSVVEKEPSSIAKSDKSLSSIDSVSEEKEEVILEHPEDVEEVEEVELTNIDGMKLNKPYYFQSRIEKLQPRLILKEKSGKFNSYTRTCSSNLRRQPVILTDEQLADINKEHKGFLQPEDVIRYGSDPTKQYNYICPRYWCLKTNTIVRPDELKEVINASGKKELQHPTCGKVLPHDAKTVKPGYYIYEFSNDKNMKKDYKRYPGLIPDSHPDGLCLPCCFDKYNTLGRRKANDKCLKTQLLPSIKSDQSLKPSSDNPNISEDEYIKNPEKFPLDAGRWGYLPPEIQFMLHQSNVDCQISKTNPNIKENYPCLLRHGIEINEKQSFISCISDVLFYAESQEKILSIKDMKQRIISSITIDTFIKYQNGNLFNDFYDPNKETEIDVNKYNKSRLFSKLNMEIPEDKVYFSKIVTAFENFIDFLNDDDVIIDHTYLWDIVCMPNQNLFPNGVNLVIFHIPKDDITNNVELICPTNHYSSEFYESRKPTILIMKEDDYYEPIYSYATNNKSITVIKEFKEYGKLSETMRKVFHKILKPFFNTVCRPLESMPETYNAKKPLLLNDLLKKLEDYNYEVQKFVLNFNNKVIGITAKEAKTGLLGFVPCYPSAINQEIAEEKELDLVFMNNLTIWNNYENTVRFLMNLDKRSKKRRPEADIPCRPAFKVVEDEMVVGILTNTNQFIQLSQPITLVDSDLDTDLKLRPFTNSNFIIQSANEEMKNVDVEVATNKEVDTERVEYVKKIKLETGFYNVFRNTVRILLNDYENTKIRDNIESEIQNGIVIYTDKLNKMNRLLRNLIREKIQFTGDENYYKLINEVSTCVVKDKDTCGSTPNLCFFTEKGDCNLILPAKNLMTLKDNEPIYYGRLADELIRYNRIQKFMFEPQNYLSFGNMEYNLRENEVILLESLLSDYFTNLIPSTSNKYVKHNSYDEVNPIKTQVYDNKAVELEMDEEETVCNKKEKDYISSGVWRDRFQPTCNEIEYGNNNSVCTFQVIIDLIERKTGEKGLTVSNLKKTLIAEYKKYISIDKSFYDKIVDILIIEGKKTLGDLVKSGLLDFFYFISNENYFLTTLDLWVLILKYEIPTIFISQKWILQTQYNRNIFVGYGNIGDSFSVIVLPGFRAEHIPNYKLIQSGESNIFFSLEESVNPTYLETINQEVRNQISINDYLINFTKISKTKYTKKVPITRKIKIIEEEEEAVVEKEVEKEEAKITPPNIAEKEQPIKTMELLPSKKQTKKKIPKGKSKKNTEKKKIPNKKYIIEEEVI
jgi:hypothetical protein